MKTINLITTHFYPEKSAGANRANSIVLTLSKNNKVNVIYLIEKGINIDLENTKKNFNKNVNFYPLKQREIDGGNFVQRLFYESYYAIRLNLKNIFIKSDISIFSIPYLMLLPISAFFSFFYSRKKIVEVRDLIWLYLDFSDKQFLQKAKNILEVICKSSIKKFDTLVTTTNSQLQYFDQEGFVIENGIDQLRFNNLKNLVLLNDNNKITISYVGTIGFPQNLITFAKTAYLLKDNNKFNFILAGKGNEVEKILQFIQDNNLKNIQYIGELNKEQVDNLYSYTNILYAQLKNTESFKTAQPSKIFEYASTGLPIIYGGVGESEKIISTLKNSILIEPDNPNKLKEVIENFSLLKKEKIEENIKFIENNFIRENIMNKYFEILK